jgi:hypothetical protein
MRHGDCVLKEKRKQTFLKKILKTLARLKKKLYFAPLRETHRHRESNERKKARTRS